MRGIGRVDAARLRVERAVERIERAAAAARAAGPHVAESSTEDGAPRPDAGDEHLRATLDAVRAEHAALQESTRAVRGRLDRAIRRIEEILES